jgi:hypothetical protein
MCQFEYQIDGSPLWVQSSANLDLFHVVEGDHKLIVRASRTVRLPSPLPPFH